MLWGVSITKLANAVITLRRASLQEKYEMLFEAWDNNNSGNVTFRRIEKGLRRLKASSDEIHVDVASEAAVKALPTNANPDTHTFDRESFKYFTEELVLQMNHPLNVVSELLLLGALELQPREEEELSLLREIKGKVDEELRTAEQHKALAEEAIVTSLFHALNLSGSGRLTFAEISHMLHKLRRDISLRQARAEAVNLMLLLDTECERSLGRVEFARFLQKLSTLMCMDANVLAEILLEITKQNKPRTLDDAATALMMETQNPISQVYETLGDRRLHLLFELWDKDADGTISFAEVALGLRKFCHDSEPANETAADAAETLLIFDADSDQRLDWADFARFVNHFCESCGTDFNTMSEYLVLLAALDDDPTEELAFLLSEEKVQRAVLDVDNMWRKEPSNETRPCDSTDAQTQIIGQESGQNSESLETVLSNVRQGIEAMNVGTRPEEPQNNIPKNPKTGITNRVSSEVNHGMRSSPFEVEDKPTGGDMSSQSQEDKPTKLGSRLSSLKTSNNQDSQVPFRREGLPSLGSRLSYRHS